MVFRINGLDMGQGRANEALPFSEYTKV